jgi:hypothetical protein
MKAELQYLLQQSEFPPQTDPFAVQMAAHLPPTQLLAAQHWPSDEHDPPSATQLQLPLPSQAPVGQLAPIGRLADSHVFAVQAAA